MTKTQTKNKTPCKWGHRCHRHQAFLRGESQVDCYFSHPQTRPNQVPRGRTNTVQRAASRRSSSRSSNGSNTSEVVIYPDFDINNIDRSASNLLNTIKRNSKGQKTLLCKHFVMKSEGLDPDSIGLKCYKKKCKFAHGTLSETNKVDYTCNRDFFSRVIGEGPAIITFIIQYLRDNFELIENGLRNRSLTTFEKSNPPEISIKNWCIFRGTRYEKNTQKMSVSELIVTLEKFLLKNRVPEWIIVFAKEQVRNMKICRTWVRYIAKKNVGMQITTDDICCGAENCIGGLHITDPNRPILHTKCYFTTDPNIDHREGIEKAAKKKSELFKRLNQMELTYKTESKAISDWEKKEVELKSSSSSSLKEFRKSMPKRTVRKDDMLEVATELVTTVYVPKRYIVPLDNITNVADSKFDFNPDSFPVFGTNAGKNENRFNKWNAKRSRQLAFLEKKTIAIKQKAVKDNSERQIAEIREKKLSRMGKKIGKKLQKIDDFVSQFKFYLQKIRFRISKRKSKEIWQNKKDVMKELQKKCSNIMEDNIREEHRIRNRSRKERRRIREDPSAFNDTEYNEEALKYHPADYVQVPLKAANIRMNEAVCYDSQEFRKAVNNKLRKKKKNNFLPADISSIQDFDGKKKATTSIYEACYAGNLLREIYQRMQMKGKSTDIGAVYHFEKFQHSLNNLKFMMNNNPEFKREIQKTYDNLNSWVPKFQKMTESIKQEVDKKYSTKIKKADDSDSDSDSESDSDSDSDSEDDSDSESESESEDDADFSGFKLNDLQFSNNQGFEFDSDDEDDFIPEKELSKLDRRSIPASLDIVFDSYKKKSKGKRSGKDKNPKIKKDKEEETKTIVNKKIVLSNIKSKKLLNEYNGKLKKKGHHTITQWNDDTKTGEVQIVLRKNRTGTIVSAATDMYDLFLEIFGDDDIVVNVNEIDSYVKNKKK